MPSDPIPPCPVCGGPMRDGGSLVECGSAQAPKCMYCNRKEAHRALCALVENGRQKFPVIEYVQLSAKMLKARDERDNAIRARDEAEAQIADMGAFVGRIIDLCGAYRETADA